MLFSNPLDSHKQTTLVSSTSLLIPLLMHKLSPAFHRPTPLVPSLPSDHLLNLYMVSKNGRALTQSTSPSHQWTMQQTLVWLLLSPLLRHPIRLMLSFGMSRWTLTDHSRLTQMFNFSSHHYGLLRTPLWTSPPVTSPQPKIEVLHQHILISFVKCIFKATICHKTQTVQILQLFPFLIGITTNQAHLLILTCFRKVPMIFGTTPMKSSSTKSGNKVLTKPLSTFPIALSLVLVVWVAESSTILIKPSFLSTTPQANLLSELVSRFSTLLLKMNSQLCNQLNPHLLSTLPWWTLVSSLPMVPLTLVFQHSSSPTSHSRLLLTLGQLSDGSIK